MPSHAPIPTQPTFSTQIQRRVSELEQKRLEQFQEVLREQVVTPLNDVLAQVLEQTAPSNQPKPPPPMNPESIVQPVAQAVTQAQSTATEEVTQLLKKTSQSTSKMVLMVGGVLGALILGLAIITQKQAMTARHPTATDPATQKDISEMAAQRDALKAELVRTEEALANRKAQMDQLGAQEEKLRLSVRQLAEATDAISQTRRATEEDIKRLQQVAEKFRFKLVPGQNGAVFVETPADAVPFTHDGKTYVKVKE